MIRDAIAAKGWTHNAARKLAVQYLIGKGKSLQKGMWLWRGITPPPPPLLPKRDLRIAARANTTFLRVLCKEMPCAFVARGVNEVSRWFHWLSTIQCTYIGEVDCKDEFNNVHPDDIDSHLAQASNWLTHRKRCRMRVLVWSVHKDTKRLDRAGKGNSSKFWYLTHERMTNTIMFEMNHNNVVRAAGQLWTRKGCIPMGGSFSAQATDLHSLWGVYKTRQKFRALGDLHMSDEGFAY